MQSPNHRPGKQETLSQHAIETNYSMGNSDMLSYDTHCRQANVAYTVKYALYKRSCMQKPKTADKLIQQISCRTRADLHMKSKAEQVAKAP